MKKIISVLAATLCTMTATSGFAMDPFQVHLEAGAAMPITKPLTNVFGPGPALEVKALWSVHSNVSIGPMVGGSYFPRSINYGKQDATLWQIGPDLRFQINRLQDNWKLPKISPWADIGVTFAANGNNSIGPAINFGIGAEGPLDNNKLFWFGPFLKYSHMFARHGFHDVQFMQIGFSLSFDLPARIPTEVKYYPLIKVKKEIIERVVIKEVPVKTEVVSFTEKIYFKVNSNSLHWESKDKLDVVVQKLNSDKSSKIIVKGNSSSDGAITFNVKLAGERMNSVVEYLVKHGIDPTRLVLTNDGVNHPAAPNATTEGRERNRRVEFEVVFEIVK